MTTPISIAIAGANLEIADALSKGTRPRLIDSTDGAVSDFPATAFLVVAEAVISSITSSNVTGAAKLEGLTLPVGFYMTLEIEAIEMTSGTVALYK